MTLQFTVCEKLTPGQMVIARPKNNRTRVAGRLLPRVPIAPLSTAAPEQDLLCLLLHRDGKSLLQKPQESCGVSGSELAADPD